MMGFFLSTSLLIEFSARLAPSKRAWPPFRSVSRQHGAQRKGRPFPSFRPLPLGYKKIPTITPTNKKLFSFSSAHKVDFRRRLPAQPLPDR